MLVAVPLATGHAGSRSNGWLTAWRVHTAVATRATGMCHLLSGFPGYRATGRAWVCMLLVGASSHSGQTNLSGGFCHAGEALWVPGTWGGAPGGCTLRVSARFCVCAVLQPDAESTSSDHFLPKAAPSSVGLCSNPHASWAVSFHHSPTYRRSTHGSPPTTSRRTVPPPAHSHVLHPQTRRQQI